MNFGGLTWVILTLKWNMGVPSNHDCTVEERVMWVF